MILQTRERKINCLDVWRQMFIWTRMNEKEEEEEEEDQEEEIEEKEKGEKEEEEEERSLQRTKQTDTISCYESSSSFVDVHHFALSIFL